MEKVDVIDNALRKMVGEMQRRSKHLYDLADEATYNRHAKLVIDIANNLVLKTQNRKFIVDENNKQLLRFLLYYFNECPLAEDVFPNKGYKCHKHLLIMGKAGCGKTLLMQIFSEYLRLTDNPNHYHNVSVTQMVNYYTLHNNLDRFTFNEDSNEGFKSKPYNLCLNDIGVLTTQFYGMDTNTLTNEFLHARNEIWANYHKMAHLTTNLTVEQLKKQYQDGFGRLLDRFKTYNIIHLKGDSKR